MKKFSLRALASIIYLLLAHFAHFSAVDLFTIDSGDPRTGAGEGHTPPAWLLVFNRRVLLDMSFQALCLLLAAWIGDDAGSQQERLALVIGRAAICPRDTSAHCGRESRPRPGRAMRVLLLFLSWAFAGFSRPRNFCPACAGSYPPSCEPPISRGVTLGGLVERFIVPILGT